MKKSIWLYIVMCLTVVCGCGDELAEEPLVSKDRVDVETKLQLQGDGEEADLQVKANCSWTITMSANWLTVNSTSGNNTETVKVSAGKNPTSEPRYATLTVKGGKAPEKYVMVTQRAGTVVPEVKTLTADVSSLAFEAKGEAKAIKIASNTTWSITGKPEWCLLSESSGSGSRDITVTANENTKTEDRSGQIVIEGDGVSKVVIDVTQKAKELQEPGSDDNTPPA